MDNWDLYSLNGYDYKVHLLGSYELKENLKIDDFFKTLNEKGWKEAHKNENLRAAVQIYFYTEDRELKNSIDEKILNPLMNEDAFDEEKIQSYEKNIKDGMFATAETIQLRENDSVNLKDAVNYLKGEHKKEQEIELDAVYNNEQTIKLDWDKKINGLRADAFITGVKNAVWGQEQKWENPEKDDVIRAFCVLYDENRQGMQTVAQCLTNGDWRDYGSIENFRKDLSTSLLKYAMEEKPENVVFNDKQLAAIEVLKTLNPDYMEMIQQDANVVNEENIEVQNVEEPQNEVQPPKVEPLEPLKHKRDAVSNDWIKVRGKLYVQELDEATLRMRGSDEYKNAREEFRSVMQKWDEAIQRGNGQILPEDIYVLRGELRNVLWLQDKYLGKKIKDKDKSSNASRRIKAQTSAFDLVEEMLYSLDVREQEIERMPAEPLEDLAARSAIALNSINNAKLFARGSEEYKLAAENFEKMNRRFKELSNKYKDKEDQITEAELDELGELIAESKDYAADYTSGKVGDAISENSHKRLKAMNESVTVLNMAERKFRELLSAKEKNRVAKEWKVISDDSSMAYVDMMDAERNVHFGSDEYKNAKNNYKEVVDLLAKLGEEGHTATVRELDELNAKMEKSAKSIDAYLATKKGETLSEKTQKRVDAMRRGKENILDIRKKVAAEELKRRNEIKNTTEETLEAAESTALTDLTTTKTRVDGNKVWFGGNDYDKALELYGKSVSNSVQRDHNRKENQPSKNSLETEIKELEAAKKACLVYIERKEKEVIDKKKPLDYKGEQRLANMKKAFDTLCNRLDKAEGKLQEMKDAEEKDMDSKATEFFEDKCLAVKNKSGLEKVAAMTSLSVARNLRAISKQKTVSAADCNSIRVGVAALLLEQGIKNKTIAAPIPGTMNAYEKQVRILAEAPELKSLLPDRILSPKGCKQIMSDPKILKGINKKFMENLQKTGAKEKNSQIKLIINKEAAKSNEGPKNPAK